ncbi:ROK family transcriptional regulator [Natronohydrobacter thiooxidans]|jgi:predicted NBD/HSP70 family sugar kinase/predicted transcriptional regulator|uniref:ROK family transcriptional regulator n=1 Tax=Natronohydrobacter thiooxidans TaxID=87172 RepID=UPI0008FF1898|nr:ROK family transcriptional regulator [Natronohydrobacter thiooxidans]
MAEHQTQLPAAQNMRGTNQSGLRAWNERLIFTLLHNNGAMPKAEIARVTGLSAQTVSVIIRALEQEGFLEKGEPVRGRIGQPSVPMSLAARGAYFLGLKIGRRSSEMILTDFHGTIRDREVLRHDWPEPESARAFALRAAHDLVMRLPKSHRERVAGLGIAQPFQLWGWSQALNAPQDVMDRWRNADLCTEIGQHLPYPVFMRNDASAACGAELVFGRSNLPRDFVYFYIGFFIGGGVVLNGALHTGEGGNSGALGSMPVRAPGGETVQLIELSSIYGLEKLLVQEGLDPDLLWQDPNLWPVPDSIMTAWVELAADAIAQAIVACLAVIDFKAVVIDGWFPPAIREKLRARVFEALVRRDLAGLNIPQIHEGSLGGDARALGAAALPLTDRFLVAADAGLGTSLSQSDLP